MHHEDIELSRLHAETQRQEKKTHSVGEEAGGGAAKQPGTYSVIPIFRYHVANLSLKTPAMLIRHHICIMFKHTTDKY